MGACCSKDITEGHQQHPNAPMSERITEDHPCPCPPSTSEEGGGISFGSGEPNVPSHWGNVKQLYCRTGYHLIIKRNGKIKGTRKPFHKNAVLEFNSVRVGEIQIKGKEAGVYLAMNRKGKLYVETDPNEEGTVFVEAYQGGWNTYLSRKYAHFGWYLAINKAGKVRAGHKTAYNHRSVMFLPRSPYPE